LPERLSAGFRQFGDQLMLQKAKCFLTKLSNVISFSYQYSDISQVKLTMRNDKTGFYRSRRPSGVQDLATEGPILVQNLAKTRWTKGARRNSRKPSIADIAKEANKVKTDAGLESQGPINIQEMAKKRLTSTVPSQNRKGSISVTDQLEPSRKRRSSNAPNDRQHLPNSKWLKAIGKSNRKPSIDEMNNCLASENQEMHLTSWQELAEKSYQIK
jgi:hypothetical protein